jgi:NAD(P)-dependent dehydrogenase (short-subunit alcohol dehydrogenase family)
MDLGLTGKVAMITGGSHGLGKQAAECLAREGCKISVCARGQEQLEATVGEFRASGYQAHGTQADVTIESDAVRFHNDTISKFGPPDILVNNVGGRRGSVLLEETTMEQFREGLEVNLISAVRLMAMTLPHMKEQGWGRIINISGLAARRSGSIIGSMRNVSLVAMTKNLADELGPDGINVSVVHPGLTRTERTPGMLADQARTKGISIEEAEEQMAQGNSVHQIIDARDVAHVVAFLASPKSIAINGDVIAAGGGVDRAIYY